VFKDEENLAGSMKKSIHVFFVLPVCIILILFLSTGCAFNGFLNSSGVNDNKQGKQENAEGQQEASSDNEEVEESTAVYEEKKETVVINFDSSVPEFISSILEHESKGLFENVVFQERNYSSTTEQNDNNDANYTSPIYVDISKSKAGFNNFIVICAVSSFFSVKDDISFSDIEDFLKNPDIPSSENENKLYISNSIGNIFKKFYGDIEGNNIVFADDKDIKEKLSQDTEAIAFLPFDSLSKDLKVLNVDGKSVFSENFTYSDYPLSYSVIFESPNQEYAQKVRDSFEDTFFSNRDPSKLATVNMTGVTALVRGVANRMDGKGILYPGEKIADILKDADITHISNEISFKDNCNAGQSGTIFCSKPEYIDLLRYVGTDVVELTGNHLNDYGYENLEKTIGMYEEEGWKYFGGGKDIALSKHPALFEINGNKIAFIGFNQFGPSYDWATKTQAGSAPPDTPFYISEIKRLKKLGYNVIFTFQYEEAYQYSPLEKQIDDFRVMRDAGADIVSGSQAHQPMGFELNYSGLICYGLGNLFFDQMQSLGTRQGIIAKHIFYNNKHISTQIIPTIIEDYCQPRQMEETEREEFLSILYDKSIKSDAESKN